MKMQESQIWVVHSDLPESRSSTFRLSGLLSEWLFATRFWVEINEKCGTMFDQYEDDEAATSIVEVIAEKLKEKALSLQLSDASVIVFTYGWKSSREPLLASVKRSQLLSELTLLHDFLSNAVTENRCLLFSL
jgi:hypothetical protein